MEQGMLEFHHQCSPVEEYYFSMHSHDRYEIYYLMKGKVLLSFKNGSFECEAGSVLLLPPGCEHEMRGLDTEEIERFSFHFRKELLPLEMQNQLLWVFYEENLDFVIQMLHNRA
ncbi:MAG: AraC family ligand binding domain-containing protein [Lachnospiraceae bacterium]